MFQPLPKQTMMESDALAEENQTLQSHGLVGIYECIAPELVEIESLLHEQMQTEFEDLQELFEHGTLLGGKRLRPALVLLSGQCVGENNHDHIVIATVMEMIHTATLIHDDVLDEAHQRRHVPTVNSKWNSHTSILLGDYLFAQAFSLSATVGSTHLCQAIGQAAKLVCEGELRQCNLRDCYSLQEDQYIDMLRCKTAELCRVSCQLGAARAGGDRLTQAALAAYGENLGIAFQIADDWLDLWGDVAQVGKTLGTDFKQGKATLPLIRLLETKPDCRRDFDRIARQEHPDATELFKLLEESDAESYTLAKAQHYALEARNALSEIPASGSRHALEQLADFAISRSF